jgi:hypothetical protein
MKQFFFSELLNHPFIRPQQHNDESTSYKQQLPYSFMGGFPSKKYSTPDLFSAVDFKSIEENFIQSRQAKFGRESSHKTAVCISGGGARSFVAALGYFAALHELGHDYNIK